MRMPDVSFSAAAPHFAAMPPRADATSLSSSRPPFSEFLAVSLRHVPIRIGGSDISRRAQAAPEPYARRVAFRSSGAASVRSAGRQRCLRRQQAADIDVFCEASMPRQVAHAASQIPPQTSPRRNSHDAFRLHALPAQERFHAPLPATFRVFLPPSLPPALLFTTPPRSRNARRACARKRF